MSETTAALVRHAIARQIKRRDVPAEATFAELDVDGLDLIEIVTELELELGIIVPDADFKVDTVTALVAVIDRLVADRERPAA